MTDEVEERMLRQLAAISSKEEKRRREAEQTGQREISEPQAGSSGMQSAPRDGKRLTSGSTNARPLRWSESPSRQYDVPRAWQDEKPAQMQNWAPVPQSEANGGNHGGWVSS